MRTVAVFLGGVLLAFVLALVIGHLLTPDAGRLIVRMFNTPPNSPDWDELWRQWHRTNMLALYVEAPLAGFCVGIFAGLLQRRHSVPMAVACLLPDFFFELRTDHTPARAHSLSGLATYLAIRSLPFLAAVLGAIIAHQIRRPERALAAAHSPERSSC